MLCAYFDRSELSKPSGVMAVNGFMTPTRDWKKFERSWQAVLDRHGVEAFHMTDFECRHGAYEHWENEVRHGFLRQLIGVLRRHASVGIGAAIVMDDYNALSQEARDIVGHPYTLCALKAVGHTFRWMDEELDRVAATGGWQVKDSAREVPVSFVFEVGDEGAGELDRALATEQRSGMYAGRIWSWGFEGKRQCGALQAADLAAYETTKQMVRTIGAEERAIRKSLERLITRVRFVGEYFNAQSLAELLALHGRRTASAP